MSSSGFSPLPLKYIEGSIVASPLRDLNNPNPAAPGQHSETQRMRELEQMLNEAQSRSQDIEREAYDKAYAAGEQAGMDLGRKRAEQMTQNMDALVQQCEKSARRLQEHMDEVVLDIADAVIRHIVGTLLDEHPAYIKQMIEQATRFLPDMNELRLAVSVQDMAMFERLLEGEPFKLVADDATTPGTCRIMASDHDILVDPHAAISECMHNIRSKLMQKQPDRRQSDSASKSAED